MHQRVGLTTGYPLVEVVRNKGGLFSAFSRYGECCVNRICIPEGRGGIGWKGMTTAVARVQHPESNQTPIMCRKDWKEKEETCLNRGRPAR